MPLNAWTAVAVTILCRITLATTSIGTDPVMLGAITMAASASFATPIGYATNMMAYGPGGYRFSGYLRLGAPLNLLMWLVAMLTIPHIWPLT